MPYQFVSEFRRGMDRTRKLSATDEGVLWELRNAHITRGGDIEKRKAWVQKYILPSNTYGLHATATQLYVFGSVASPSVPSGVTYQRLVAPNGSAMTRILSTTNFDGLVYAIAKFADGGIHHYYNGSLVTDWEAGIVTAEMVNMTGVAAAMATLINTNSEVVATPSTNTVVVEKATNGTFDIDAFAQSAAGADLPNAVTLVQNRVGSGETISTGSFRVVQGVSSPGTNKITSLTVNGVQLLTGGAIDFAADSATTAINIAAAINTLTTTPDYDAEAVDDTVFIKAKAGTGIGPNGFIISITTAGRFIVNIGSFDVISGSTNPGQNRIKKVLVNGVQVLAGNVNYNGGNDQTAADIASSINSAGTYKSFNVNNTVYLYKTTNNAPSSDTLPIAFNVDGNFQVGNAVPFGTTINHFAGGSVGAKEKWTITFVGPFTVGDRYTVVIDDTRYGAADNPTAKASRAITFGSKIYAIGQSILFFSGVNTATGWNSTDDAGAGFINIATQDGGSQDLIGIEVYQGSIAVGSRNSIQVVAVDTNPNNNYLFQPVKHTGFITPHGQISINGVDTLYISYAGHRSLRARDSSSAAISIDDIGTFIDKVINPKIAALSDNDREGVCSVIEPVDGRYMVFIDNEAYVLSEYRSKDIRAWSVYDTPDGVTEAVEMTGKIFIRTGNSIYLLGGDNNDTYDSSVVTAQMSYFHNKKPAHKKDLTGIDVDVVNTWTVSILTDPRDETQLCHVGDIEEFSYDGLNWGATGTQTHMAPKFVCSQPGYASLSNFALHYNQLDEN